jgi:2-polyprenyl-6-methoxyphenol hydroxylase-like FAD-dependent oxidoreductase
VRVVERHDRVNTAGAALGLWPPAQAGLAALGVTERLSGAAVPYREALVRDPAGRVLAALPLDRIERRHGRPVLLVRRPALMEALLVTAGHCGIPSPEMGAPASVPELLAEGVDLVVGADGVSSVARRYVAPEARPPRALGAVAWRGSCPGHVGRWGEVWGPGVLAGVTPAGPDATNWYVAVRDRVGILSFAALRSALSDWPEPLPEVLAKTDPADVLRHALHDLPGVPRYARGCVALVGDAAHAMAPSLGQGACQAVMDALALSRCVSDRVDVPAALADYNRVRRPTGRRFVRASRTLLAMQTAESPSSRLRDSLLATAWKVGPHRSMVSLVATADH